MGGDGLGQSLASGGVRQDKVVIDLEQHQWVTQALAALTRRGAAPSNPHHSLTQTQIEPGTVGRRVAPPTTAPDRRM